MCVRERMLMRRDGVQLSEEVMSDDELSCQILFCCCKCVSWK